MGSLRQKSQLDLFLRWIWSLRVGYKVVLVPCKVVEFSSIWGRHWWLAFYCTVNSGQIGTRHHLLDKRNIVFKGKQQILTRASIENIVRMSLPFISLGWSCTLCTVVANEILKWKKKDELEKHSTFYQKTIKAYISTLVIKP